MITITGGKWTTYRKMAEDAVSLAAEKNNLLATKCITKELQLTGHNVALLPADISICSDEEIKALIKTAVQDEMCRTIEDFLSRRTRQLLLDAKLAITKAPLVAKLLAEELNKDDNWITGQINNFNYSLLIISYACIFGRIHRHIYFNNTRLWCGS
jgi:glycerol-3-phosphate dehydrogenase